MEENVITKNIKYDIARLLPHKPPMVFISGIKKVDLQNGTLTAKVVIKESDMLYDSTIKGVPSYASLEYMAQAIGCFAGISDLTSDPNIAPRVGFIMGTRKLSLNAPILKLGMTYFVDVHTLFSDGNIVSFECRLYDDNVEIASATINAYRPDDVDEFILNLK